MPDLFRFMLFLNLMCVALDMGLTCQTVLSPKAERVSKMLMVTNQHNVWQYQRRMVILIGDGNTYAVCGRCAGWPRFGQEKSRGVAGGAECPPGHFKTFLSIKLQDNRQVVEVWYVPVSARYKRHTV